MKKNLDRKSLYIYLGMMAITLLGICWGNFLEEPYPYLRIWTWENIAWMAIGIPFIFLFKDAGIPPIFPNPDNKTSKNHHLTAIWIGIAFGILDIIVIKGILHPEPYTELPPFLQPFPYSLFLYFSGAFEIEVFYRLIPITLVLYIFSKVKKGHFQNEAFWIIAILTSLREPLEQLPTEPIWLIIYSFITGFVMNFIQAWYFKNHGFLASLSVRMGHYLFWHILLGIYVQWFELT